MPVLRRNSFKIWSNIASSYRTTELQRSRKFIHWISNCRHKYLKKKISFHFSISGIKSLMTAKHKRICMCSCLQCSTYKRTLRQQHPQVQNCYHPYTPPDKIMSQLYPLPVLTNYEFVRIRNFFSFTARQREKYRGVVIPSSLFYGGHINSARNSRRLFQE